MEDMQALVERRDLVRQVLERARIYVTGDNTWIQDRMSIDADGECVSVSSPKAAAFCAVGAILRAHYVDVKSHRFFSEEALFKMFGMRREALMRLNDEDGRAASLQVIDVWLEKHPD